MLYRCWWTLLLSCCICCCIIGLSWCSTNVSTSVFYQKLPTLLLPLKTWVYESVENFYLNITGSVWTDSWLRTAVLDGVSRLLSTEILLQLNNKRTIHHELGYTLFWSNVIALMLWYFCVALSLCFSMVRVQYVVTASTFGSRQQIYCQINRIPCTLPHKWRYKALTSTSLVCC